MSRGQICFHISDYIMQGSLWEEGTRYLDCCLYWIIGQLSLSDSHSTNTHQHSLIHLYLPQRAHWSFLLWKINPRILRSPSSDTIRHVTECDRRFVYTGYDKNGRQTSTSDQNFTIIMPSSHLVYGGVRRARKLPVAPLSCGFRAASYGDRAISYDVVRIHGRRRLYNLVFV